MDTVPSSSRLNYAVGNSFGTQVSMSRDNYLVGTVPTIFDASQILSREKMSGPFADGIPNHATKYLYAYLVGERR